LLVRPGWRGASTSIRLFVVSRSAGAVAISLLMIAAARFAWSSRIRFDSERGVIRCRFAPARAARSVQRREHARHVTEREQRVKAGQAIVRAPGEPHGARVETGAVSINVDLA
jgi:hypothetical protein